MKFYVGFFQTYLNPHALGKTRTMEISTLFRQAYFSLQGINDHRGC